MDKFNIELSFQDYLDILEGLSIPPIIMSNEDTLIRRMNLFKRLNNELTESIKSNLEKTEVE